MSDDNEHISYLISQAMWEEASTNTKNHPKAKKHREIAAHITTLRARVAGLEERVRLLNAECWAWREHKGISAVSLLDFPIRKAMQASDAASAVKEPA